VETAVSDYPSDAGRLAILGCLTPGGLAILPDNFGTASTPEDFVYAATAPTVVLLHGGALAVLDSRLGMHIESITLQNFRCFDPT
jgi:hypothetical protein